MAGFAEILAEVEAAATDAEAERIAPTLRFGFEIAPAPACAPTGAQDPPQGVIAAYRETIEARATLVAQPSRRDVSVENLTAGFPRKLSAARNSPRKLSMLRREIAWMLHPDRIGSDASEASRAMAHFNAMIDAALAQCEAEAPSARSEKMD